MLLGRFSTTTTTLVFVVIWYLNVRCGHCQRLAPTWDELAAHFEKRSDIHISKLDCTLHSSTCQRQGVKGYPTLLLFVNGEVEDKYSGSRELDDLIDFVNKATVDSPQDDQQVYYCICIILFASSLLHSY